MRNLKLIATLLILSFLALCVADTYADATNTTNFTESVTNATNVTINIVPEETPNSSYVEVSYDSPPINGSNYNVSHFPNVGTYRIAQGQAVFLNDTIDISGLGWGTGVAWYGRWEEFDDPQYIRLFTNYRSDEMNFWIDPAIFGNRTGMWYQYYGNNASEPNGNLASFYVKASYRNTTYVFPNGTIMNETVAVRNASEFTPLVIPQPSILPEVRVADYLLAIGDPLILKTGGSAEVWIFGRVDHLYGNTTNDNMTFPGSAFTTFEPGRYTMLVQHPGNNTEFDVRLDNNTLQYRDGWNGVKSIDVSAMAPVLVEQQLKQLLENTDDTYTVYNLSVQQPSLAIESMDEIYLENKTMEYRLQGHDVMFKDVRGYTNLINQTNITVILDDDYVSDTGTGRYITFATTRRTQMGNLTMFQALVPILYDQIPVGMHKITAVSPLGTYADADFDVSVLPNDSFRPAAMLKYTGDSDPWKPNLTIPTPVVVEVPGPTQIVTVKVTPSPAEVKAAQDAVASEHERTWAAVITGGIVLVVLLVYLYTVVRRWKRGN